MNWNQVVDGSNIELYSCLLQWIDKSAKENIIQVKAISTSGYYFESNRMIKFELTKREIRRYLNSNFKIENVQVAIIRKDEFDKNLTEIELNSRLDSIDTSTFQKIVLPFSFIKYQKPYLIDGRRNLTKSIGACITFLYGDVLPHIENWIDIHFNFGIEEIMFYDCTSTQIELKSIYFNSHQSIINF